MEPLTETTDRLHPGSRPGVALYLRSNEGRRLRGPLGRLARLFGLDVYGTSLLGRRSQIEMKGAALILLVVFLFDLGAWTLLFNAIFHARLFTVGPATILAVAAALLFATIVVLYERQFLTADTTVGWRKLAGPTALRLTIIIGAALITAQPVELLFFREPIHARSHEEGIRRELATRWKQVETLRTEMADQRRQLDQLTQTLSEQDEYQRMQAAREDLKQLIDSEAQLQRDLSEAQQQAQRWLNIEVGRKRQRDAGRQALERASAGAPFLAGEPGAVLLRLREEADATERSYREAIGEKSRWRKRAADLERELGIITGQRPELATTLHEAEEDYDERRAALEGEIETRRQDLWMEEERLQRWIRRLRGLDAPPATLVREDLEPGEESGYFGRRAPFEYRTPSYDFFAQLRVLSDLHNGRPPEWPGSSGEAVELLETEFGLTDPPDCSPQEEDAGLCDPAWLRARATARIYRYSYLAVLALGMVIPLMVLAAKLLMPKELKTYYSTASQAAHGNPEAVRILRTERPAPHHDLLNLPPEVASQDEDEDDDREEDGEA